MPQVVIPRGIQIVERINAKKQRVIRYRVRIKKKVGSINRYFDELDDAIAFRKQASLTPAHLEGIAKAQEEEKRQLEMNEMVLAFAEEYVSTFDNVLEVYEQRVIERMPTATELHRRNKSGRESFIRTIRSVTIQKTVKVWDAGPSGRDAEKQPIKFCDIPADKVSRYDINAYIEARLATGVKKSSVSREIGIISKAFQEAMKLEEWESLSNPVPDYDKDLLSGQELKKKIRLRPEETDRLFAALKEYPNPDMARICALGLATAMRRSEILTLTWGQVFPKHLMLYNTKIKKSRPVFMIAEARAIFEALPRGADHERVFTGYSSIAGFEGSFSKLMDSLKLPHITFHVFRKEAFSRFFEKLQGGSAAILAEFLGVANVKKFKESYADVAAPDTEEGILAMGGNSLQVNKDHYLTLLLDAPEKSPNS